MNGVQYMKFTIDPLNLDSFDRQVTVDPDGFDKLTNSITNNKVAVALINIKGVGEFLITGSSFKTDVENTIDQRTNPVTFIIGDDVLTATPVMIDGKKNVVFNLWNKER